MATQWLLVSELDGLAEGYRVLAVLESGDHPAHTATGEIIVSRTGLVGTAFELPGTDDIVDPSGCYWVITAGSKTWRITLPDSLGTSQGSPVLVGELSIQRAPGTPPPSWPAGALPGLGGTTGQAWTKLSDADNDTGWVTGSGGGGSVDSVNGISPVAGDVTLTASDVGADVSGAAAAATASAAQRASNLSDLVSASTARTNLGLGTAATADKVAAGSAGVLDATDATTTNARTPTAHAASHASAGGDAVTLAQSQVTDLATDLGAKLVKASNLSDLASASTARTNLGLGGAAVLDVGTTAGTVAAGDDPRIAKILTAAAYAGLSPAVSGQFYVVTA